MGVSFRRQFPPLVPGIGEADIGGSAIPIEFQGFLVGCDRPFPASLLLEGVTQVIAEIGAIPPQFDRPLVTLDGFGELTLGLPQIGQTHPRSD